MTNCTATHPTHTHTFARPCSNEAGCGQGATQPALDFRMAIYANDGSRAAGANMGWLSPITPSNMRRVARPCPPLSIPLAVARA